MLIIGVLTLEVQLLLLCLFAFWRSLQIRSEGTDILQSFTVTLSSDLSSLRILLVVVTLYFAPVTLVGSLLFHASFKRDRRPKSIAVRGGNLPSRLYTTVRVNDVFYTTTLGFTYSRFPKITSCFGASADMEFVRARQWETRKVTAAIGVGVTNPHAIAAHVRRFLLDRFFSTLAPGVSVTNVGGRLSIDLGPAVRNLCPDLDPRDAVRGDELPGRVNYPRRDVAVPRRLEDANTATDVLLLSHSVYDISHAVAFTKALQLGVRTLGAIFTAPVELLRGGSAGFSRGAQMQWYVDGEEVEFVHTNESCASYRHNIVNLCDWMGLNTVRVVLVDPGDELPVQHEFVVEGEARCEHLAALVPRAAAERQAPSPARRLHENDDAEDEPALAPQNELGFVVDGQAAPARVRLAEWAREAWATLMEPAPLEVGDCVEVCYDCAGTTCCGEATMAYSRDIKEDCSGIILNRYAATLSDAPVGVYMHNSEESSVIITFEDGMGTHKMLVPAECWMRMKAMVTSATAVNTPPAQRQAKLLTSRSLAASVLSNMISYTGDCANRYIELIYDCALAYQQIPERFAGVISCSVSHCDAAQWIKPRVTTLKVRSRELARNVRRLAEHLGMDNAGHVMHHQATPGAPHEIMDAYRGNADRFYLCGRNFGEGRPDCHQCDLQNVRSALRLGSVVVSPPWSYTADPSASDLVYVNVAGPRDYSTIDANKYGQLQQTSLCRVLLHALVSSSEPVSDLQSMTVHADQAGGDQQGFLRIADLTYNGGTAYGILSENGMHRAPNEDVWLLIHDENVYLRTFTLDALYTVAFQPDNGMPAHNIRVLPANGRRP